jgi:uncharacterized protein
MPRPPARGIDLSADNVVDAAVCARAGSTIERSFSAAELPRLREAGGNDGSSIEAKFQFSQFDGRPAVTGELHGKAMLTCQRCMQPAAIDIDDTFQVLIVEEERGDEPGGYEPVVAKASQLDLAWLAEEQALLALPLVPMHERGDCQTRTEVELTEAVGDEDDEEAAESGKTQHPFQNLRDLLRKQ